MKKIKIVWHGFLRIKRAIRREIEDYKWYVRHEMDPIKTVSENLTKPEVLTDEQKTEIKEFWSRYNYDNILFHEFYTQKTGCYSKYYLPEEIYDHKVDNYYSPPNMAKFFDNKCYYSRIFPNLRHPEMIAYRCNGFWYDGKNVLISRADLTQILSKFNGETFLKAATNSMGGKGVTYFSNCAAQSKEIFKTIDSMKCDIVIQKGIQQHESLKSLNASSVNTVRVLSLLSENKTTVYSSVLRMGLDGSHVDNGSSGGIAVGILSNGQLKQNGFKDNIGEIIPIEHPTSHVKFSSIIIPNYKKVLELVKESHPLIPHFRLVSWDFAIDYDGKPVLVEVNLSLGDLYYHQICNGPLFGDETKAILDEVYGIKD